MLCHVPPGTNLYGQKPFWKDNWTDQYVQLLDQTKCLDKTNPLVVGSFCGHTHLDEFRVICKDNAAVGYVHIVPGIDADHSNNPAYQVLTIDDRGEVINYTNYFLTNFADLASNGWASSKPVWTNEYDFATAFPSAWQIRNGYNADALSKLQLEISSKTAARTNWLKYYHSGYVTSPELKDSNLTEGFEQSLKINVSR